MVINWFVVYFVMKSCLLVYIEQKTPSCQILMIDNLLPGSLHSVWLHRKRCTMIQWKYFCIEETFWGWNFAATMAKSIARMLYGIISLRVWNVLNFMLWDLILYLGDEISWGSKTFRGNRKSWDQQLKPLLWFVCDYCGSVCSCLSLRVCVSPFEITGT